MPEVDGIEGIRTLKTKKPVTKFIAISGGYLHDVGNRLPEALELGAVYTFGKPIDNK